MTSPIGLELLSQKPPPKLYHYTSHYALVSILESAEIWASNIAYLNDRAEFSHAIDLARAIVKDELANERMKRRAKYLRKIDQGLRMPLIELSAMIYVASFCEGSDALTLWRGYCPKNAGYSLGYDWSQDTNNAICFTRCLYEDAQKRSAIKECLDEFFNLTNDQLTAHLAGQRQVHWAALGDEITIRSLQFVQRLAIFAPAFKDAAFRDEREWRVVYFKPSESFEPQFRCGERMLIPYAPIPLRSGDRPLVIPEIVVGPTDHPAEARCSLEGFLRRTKNVTCDKVTSSAVPFRHL